MQPPEWVEAFEYARVQGRGNPGADLEHLSYLGRLDCCVGFGIGGRGHIGSGRSRRVAASLPSRFTVPACAIRSSVPHRTGAAVRLARSLHPEWNVVCTLINKTAAL